jgi:hypothetical protein
LCNSSLSQDQYKKAILDLQKTIFRNYKQKHREERKEWRAKIGELKALHKSQVRSVIIQEKNGKKALEEKYREQTRKERKKFRQDLKQTRRRYQAQAEQLRTFNSEQTANLQAQLRSEYGDKLLEMTKRYEDLSANITQKLEVVNANIISELQNRLNNAAPVAQSPIDNEIGEPQREGGIPTSKKEDIEEKRLEIERLKKIQEISEMIKEIAAQNPHETL